MKSLLTFFAFILCVSFAFGQSMTLSTGGTTLDNNTASGSIKSVSNIFEYSLGTPNSHTLTINVNLSTVAAVAGTSRIKLNNTTQGTSAEVVLTAGDILFGGAIASTSFTITKEGVGGGDLAVDHGDNLLVFYDETNDDNPTAGGTDFATWDTGGALPVEFKKFEAAPLSNNTVALNWETGTEINNDYFTIERSKDGVNFDALGEVDGAGTSTEARSYEFVDASPLAGKSYYRIKQTDFDGAFEYSDVAMVEVKKSNQVILLPTASYSAITVQTAGSSKDRTVVITDMLGQEIQVLNIAADATQLELNIEGYAKGAYNISIYEGNEVTTKRFVKL